MQPEIIYNETDVPSYVLPDLLVDRNGNVVADPSGWAMRRSEILRLFQEQMYGEIPQEAPSICFELQESSDSALDGWAKRRQVAIRIGSQPNSCMLNLLIYLPVDRDGPTPLFLGLNFAGNHTIHADPNILLSEGLLASGQEGEPARGSKASRWCVEEIIERGYGLATIYCGDMAIDDEAIWQNRAYAQLLDPEVPRHPSTAGAIGIWAWGLSRAMDYFETDAAIDSGIDPGIDPTRVAVMGHSRLGKTALWAGVQDERFRMVISNNSGCGGAALSRRCFGETVHEINRRFPHWFCEHFRQYSQNEAALPVDQHMLLALVAPRPLYVASAQDDRWADPRGEFLGIKHASPAYQLLDQTGLPPGEMPALNEPTIGSIGYHIRTGGHDVTSYDWTQYMNFADRYL